MSGDIHAHLDPLFSKYRKINEKHSFQAENALSSEKGLVSPADSPVNYEATLGFSTVVQPMVFNTSK